MANTVVISGPTFNNKIGSAIPIVPALSTMAFFGTGYDGIETNRVPGGPTIIPHASSTASVVHSSNYITVGELNLAGACASLDTQNPVNTTTMNSGMTLAACVRQNSSTGTAECIGDNSQQLCLSPAIKSIQLYSGGLQATLAFNTPPTNWRIIATTYSGGGALGTNIIYDLTENLGPVSWTRTSNRGTGSIRLGGVTPGGFDNDPADVCWIMVANSVMTQAALTALAASIRSFLARRSIVC